VAPPELAFDELAHLRVGSELDERAAERLAQPPAITAVLEVEIVVRAHGPDGAILPAMPIPELRVWLSAASASNDVVEWASTFGDDWQRAWRECPRADWLLAIAARLGIDTKLLVLAAAATARTSLDAIPAHETRPLAAIEAAEAWARGEITGEELRDKARAADEVTATDPACAAAIASAWAAATSAEERDHAAVAAANAAQAALFGAADCAMMSLLKYAQRTGADKVREHIAAELVGGLVPTSA
jgi:Imm-5 like putative immunity protein